MPRMILLNGPPSCGKSTLARRYAQEHPLSLNLYVDRIRDLIGGWQDEPHTAGLLARALALATARTHLMAGYDVVIPQFLARAEFIEQIEQLAGERLARSEQTSTRSCCWTARREFCAGSPNAPGSPPIQHTCRQTRCSAARHCRSALGHVRPATRTDRHQTHCQGHPQH
jgi:hypothetical protein